MLLRKITIWRIFVLTALTIGLMGCAEREIVDHGDGTYSYALSPDTNVEQRLGNDNISFGYVEQARHRFRPEPRQRVNTHTQPLKAPTPQETIEKIRVFDDKGRVWRIDSIADDALPPPASQPDPAERGFEGHLPGEEFVIVDDTAGWWEADCDNNPSDKTPIDIGTWDGESRVDADWETNPSFRQKAVMEVKNLDTGGVGTGTLIRDNWIITAAHAVVGAAPSEIQITASPAAGVHPSAEVQFGQIYIVGDATDPVSTSGDWAFIRVANSYSGVTPFNMSTASDSVIDRVGAHWRGIGKSRFIQIGNLCYSNPYPVLWSDDFEVTYKSSSYLKWKGDSAGWWSGTGIYYCPAGDDTKCAGNDIGWIIAINKGRSGERCYGARVSNFKDVANATMDFWDDLYE